jgi:hypothetical protein
MNVGDPVSASLVLTANPLPARLQKQGLSGPCLCFPCWDGWDQVPYRENYTDFKALPKTLKGLKQQILSSLN